MCNLKSRTSSPGVSVKICIIPFLGHKYCKSSQFCGYEGRLASLLSHSCTKLLQQFCANFDWHWSCICSGSKRNSTDITHSGVTVHQIPLFRAVQCRLQQPCPTISYTQRLHWKWLCKFILSKSIWYSGVVTVTYSNYCTLPDGSQHGRALGSSTSVYQIKMSTEYWIQIYKQGSCLVLKCATTRHLSIP